MPQMIEMTFSGGSRKITEEQAVWLADRLRRWALSELMGAPLTAAVKLEHATTEPSDQPDVDVSPNESQAMLECLSLAAIGSDGPEPHQLLHQLRLALHDTVKRG